MRDDAVAIHCEGHAGRRVEGSLEPREHELRVERLIGFKMRHDSGRIDPRLVQELQRVDSEWTLAERIVNLH